MAYYFWFSIFGHSHSPLPLPPPLFVSRPFLIYTLKTLTLPNSLTLYNKNKDIYTHFYSVTFYYEDIYFIEFVRELKGWDWLWEWLILKLLASLIFVSGIGYRGV